MRGRVRPLVAVVFVGRGFSSCPVSSEMPSVILERRPHGVNERRPQGLTARAVGSTRYSGTPLGFIKLSEDTSTIRAEIRLGDRNKVKRDKLIRFTCILQVNVEEWFTSIWWHIREAQTATIQGIGEADP